ncbi:beta strand repeat-containing protein [Cohnella yongneupensis]|uniref:Ig-like domain-containing protein n=1 Tax=Cohnella yongneupensis TaxID=425006 RepID=A0ABW0R5J9_9BACL
MTSIRTSRVLISLLFAVGLAIVGFAGIASAAPPVPSATPGSGNVTVGSSIVLDNNSNGTVCYTTGSNTSIVAPSRNGTTPIAPTQCGSSNQGNATVTVSGTVGSQFVIKAGAFSIIDGNSAIQTFTYTIVAPTAAPTAYPGNNAILNDAANTIKLVSATSGATIYYTVGNTSGSTPSDPTTSSQSVTNGGTITLTGVDGNSTKVKAMAASAGASNSPVITFSYTFSNDSSVNTPTLAAGSAASGSVVSNNTNITINQNDSDTSTRTYYTTDGSMPSRTNNTGNTTNNSITLSLTGSPGQTVYVKAFNTRASRRDSDVLELQYKIYSIPTVASSAKNGTEDNSLSFGAADFTGNYADADGQSLNKIKITELPTAAQGLLKIGGSNASLNQEVTAANLGTITFAPAQNFNGDATFKWSASDGTNYSSTSATLTMSIAAVNDAPTITDITNKSTNEDTATSPAITFTVGDVETAAGSLTVSGSSSSQTLVPDANIVFGGSGASRTVTITPALNQNGSATISITVNDGTTSVSDTFLLTVNPVNDAPVAVADNGFSITEDGTLTTVIANSVLNNDSDVDGNTLTAVKVSNPSNGSVTLNANGTFTYTPAANFNGTDSFTYKANDGTVDSNVVSVTISVTAVNDAPVAVGDSGFSVAEDGTLTTAIADSVLNNDSDVDGNTLTAVKVSNPSNGSVTLNANGTFTYTPTANFNGTDSFTYNANDGTVDSNVVSVTISVTAVNDAPVAVADSGFSVAEDGTLTTAIADSVLNNDSDIDGNTLTAVKVSNPSNGSVTLNANGTFTYTPTANFNGTDSFTYNANDGAADSNVVSVTISVTAVNDAPVATNGDLTVEEDSSATGTLVVTDIDSASLIYSITQQPAHGTVVITNTATGAYKYTATDPNWTGGDSFKFKARDGAVGAPGALDSNEATVTVAYTAVNDAPTIAIALNDKNATEDAPFSFAIPAGTFADVDAGDHLTITVSGLPSWLTFAGGTLSGTPANADVGEAVITVAATDDSGATASDTFTITIANTNDAPTVAVELDDTNATEDVPFSFVIPAGTFADVDEGDHLTLTASGLPSWLTFNGSEFSGTPANADVGEAVITVTATDGSSATTSDTFTITIANANDAPTLATAIADQNATEDAPFSFAIPAGTFADVDAGDHLTLTASGLPSWLTFDGSTFSGTPVNADVGEAVITVTATDDSGAFVSDTFKITIANTNDAPTVAVELEDKNATEDAPFSFEIPVGTFADVDAGDHLTLTASGLPSWLTFNGSEFSGTPANADVGEAVITVTATDSSGATASDTFKITIANTNDTPMLATAIADQNATEDAPFSFAIPAGTFAEVDAGDHLTYTASGLPTWLTFDGSTFNGTPANENVGESVITVTATDDSGATVTDTFTITIANTNDAPTVAVELEDKNATEDAPFSFAIPAGTFADVDEGDHLTLTASGLPSWLTFDGSEFSGTPANADVGEAVITVTATDGSGATTSDTFTITIANTNDTPTLATAIADQNATEDAAFSFAIPAGTFADVDAGDHLTYSASGLPTWLTFDGSTFNGTPANEDVGESVITVTATDDSGATVTDTFKITVANTNDAPVATTGSLTVVEDLSASGTLAATDIDSASLTYSIVQQPGHGTVSITNAATGAYTYTATDLNWTGGDSFTFKATDSDGADSNVATVTVAYTPVNDAPVISKNGSGNIDFTPPIYLTVGASPLILDLSSKFSDVDGDSVTLNTVSSSISSVASVSINGSTSVRIIPVAGGTATITISVKDGHGGFDTATFSVTINGAPTVNGKINNQTLTVATGSKAVDISTKFSDPNGDPLTITAISSNPSLVTIDPLSSNTSIVLKPVATGTATITVTANDQKGGTVSTSFTVTVNNSAPVVNYTMPSVSVMLTESSKSVTVPADLFFDADNDALTFTVASDRTSVATVSIIGNEITIIPLSKGTAKVTVTANDGHGGTKATSFNVNVNTAPNVIPGHNVPDVTYTVAGGKQTISASDIFSDDDGDNLTLSAVTGSSDITVTVSGKNILVTPTHRTPIGTPALITVTANDGKGGTVTDEFYVTVVNSNPTARNVANKTVRVGKDITVNLSNTFADVDGDSLVLSVSTSSSNITASLNGTDLVIHGEAETTPGSDVLVTIVADDQAGGTVTTTLYVKVNP